MLQITFVAQYHTAQALLSYKVNERKRDKRPFRYFLKIFWKITTERKEMKTKLGKDMKKDKKNTAPLSSSNAVKPMFN